MADADLAKAACLDCRRLKRRCNRHLPVCALCMRVGRPCRYDSAPATPASTTTIGTPSHGPLNTPSRNVRQPMPPARQPISLRGSRASTSDRRDRAYRFPAAWFLDSVVSRGSKVAVPASLEWLDVVDDPLCLTLDQASTVANDYFESTQTWMPIGTSGLPCRIPPYTDSTMRSLEDAGFSYAEKWQSTQCRRQPGTVL